MWRPLTRPGWVFGAIGAFCAVLILLIWVRLHRQLVSDRQQTVAAAVQRNSNLAVALEQYAIGTISHADAELQLIKRKYEKSPALFNLATVVDDQIADKTGFQMFGIADAGGRVQLTNAGLYTAPATVAGQSWFTHHQVMPDSNLFIGLPAVWPPTGKAVIALSRRLSHPDGRFAGVVAVLLEPAIFTRFYANAALRPNDIISLIAPDGTTYSRRTGAVESYGENISKSPLFRHLEKQATGDYYAADAIHQVPTFFSYRRFVQYPIIATVGTSEADVLGGYEQKAFRDKAAAAIITGLVLLFSLLVLVVLLHRKKTIEWIKESEAKYRSVFENSLDVIALIKPDGHVIAANKAAVTFFGYTLSDLHKGNIRQLVHVTDPAFRQLVKTSNTTGTAQGELTFMRADGQPITGEVAAARYKTAEGKRRYIIIIRDSTQRIRLQNKLVAEQKRYQRRVTEQVIWAQEREREVIGHELHDNINQVLSTVKLYLEMALSYKDKREELLPKSIEYLMISINEIRKLSHDLSAPTLGTKSLIDSVMALVETVQSSTGLLLAFDYDNYTDNLPMDQKLAIYRIAQEQLNNIIKHARASSVTIRLSQADGQTCLTIIDDGQGFNPTAGRRGIGLNNIISRAKVFDGRVEIESAPGDGCQLMVCLPLPPGVVAASTARPDDDLEQWNREE